MLDVRTYGAVPDGLTDCSGNINTALVDGDIIIQNGVFSISDAISIPSNRTVYIKNAEIKSADSTYKSIFKNSDFENGNTNIKIIGLGCAVLNGNAENNDDRAYVINPTYSEGCYNHNQIIFANVNIFEVSGLITGDRTKYWFNLQKCTNGIIDDVFMDVMDTQDNQDGISFRWLNNNVVVSNIRGRSYDDFCSVNCSYRAGIQPQIPAQLSGDSHDISFDDLNVGFSRYRGTIILNGEGNKIYNIAYNRIKAITTRGFMFMGPPGYVLVRPGKNDTYNITFDDVEVDTLDAEEPVFNFYDSFKDFTAIDIINNSENDMWEDSDATQEKENVIINGQTVFS